MNDAGLRIVVVGAGVAGAAAALAAARPRVRVTVVDGGAGASALSTGAVDLTPWTAAGAPEEVLPEAALHVLSALGVYALPPAGAWLVTTAGVRRPARGHDAALLDIGPLADGPLGVVRCERPGWDADSLTRAWGGACVPVDVRVLRHADERALPDADFAARHDLAGRIGWLAERVREALSARSGLAGLVLPPSLGLDRPLAPALSQLAGLPCGEPVAMPGGPSGLRFERARDRAFEAAGVERVRARALRVEAVARDPGDPPLPPADSRHRPTAWRITIEGAPPLDADAVVLATGGLLGGGIEYSPSEAILANALPPRSRPPLRATIDAPLSVGAHGRRLETPGSLFGLPAERIAWPFADGLLARAGVLARGDGACVGAPRGLFAAGELVADAPRTWLAALISGAEAGRSAARPIAI